MEKYDPEMAERVWQRVRGEPSQRPAPMPTASARTLGAAEAEQAAALLRLSGQLQGRERTLLHRLYQEEIRHAHILRGIELLTTGKCPALTAPPSGQSTPEIALRKCCGAALRAMKAYEARADDPEYGPVFAELARQEQTHCAAILALLGSRKA